jgi:hypothetical protein
VADVQTVRSRVLRAAALCSSLLLAAALGCRREPAQSPENVERTALVAQKCPEIAAGSGLIDAKNARVFVEVVALSGSEPPNPIGDWLDEHAVTVRSSSNLVAFPNIPTSMPWGQCVDAVCNDSQRTLTVTAQLPKLGSEPIELAVHIEEAAPNTAGATPKVLLDTTLRAPSQEPVVLPIGALLSSGTVVVTSYLLRQIDDLHRLLECKVRQADREKQLQ